MNVIAGSRSVQGVHGELVSDELRLDLCLSFSAETDEAQGRVLRMASSIMVGSCDV